MNNNRGRVGPVTLAVSLLVIGLLLLLYNFGVLQEPSRAWKLWPLLLIGVGVEYFVRKFTNKDKEVHFHIPSLLFMGLIILTGTAVSAVSSFVGYGLLDIVKDNVVDGRESHRHSWQSDPIPVTAGTHIIVDNRTGRVQIRPSSDKNVHVRADVETRAATAAGARELADNFEVRVETGETLRITPGMKGQEGNSSKWNNIVALYIEVPSEMQIEAHNDMGDMEVTGVTGNLVLRGQVGKIQAADIAGDIEISNNIGDVTVENIRGHLKVQNDNGRIYVQNPGGNVLASAHNGEVELNSREPLSGDYHLETSNGRVKMSLPQNSNLSINAETNHGAITGAVFSSDNIGKGRANTASASLGDGKGSARLRTNLGAVEVNTF